MCVCAFTSVLFTRIIRHVTIPNSGRLRSGDCGLRLWKGREIKGIDDNAVPPNFATHPANNPHLKAVRLTVTFQMVKLVPIFYPSTAEESRTVLTRSEKM